MQDESRQCDSVSNEPEGPGAGVKGVAVAGGTGGVGKRGAAAGSGGKLPRLGRQQSIVVAGLVSLLFLSFGYMVLYGLLQSRPQFVDWGLHHDAPSLVQASPTFALRRISGLSHDMEIKAPDVAEVVFDMRANKDWRGMHGVRSIEGNCEARFVLENPYPEPVHALFHLPGPKSERGEDADIQMLNIGAADGSGLVQRDQHGAWVWSGQIEADGEVELEVSYTVEQLSGVSYEVAPKGGGSVKDLTVTVNLNEKAHLVVSPPTKAKDGELKRKLYHEPDPVGEDKQAVVWERKNYISQDTFSARLETGHSIFSALERLLQVAPLVTGMFLVTLVSFLGKGRTARPSEVFLLAMGYGYYFPLVLYLNAQYQFTSSLLIAFVTSAVILLNYARFLLGGWRGVLGGLVLLGLYQIVPTMMAFAEWDRGMVLLSLGAVMLCALVDLQTQKLKQAVSVGALGACAILPAVELVPFQGFGTRPEGVGIATANVRHKEATIPEVVVSFPARLWPQGESGTELEDSPDGMLSLGVASYEMTLSDTSLDIQVSVDISASGSSQEAVLLFPPQTYVLELEMPPFLALRSNKAGLAVQLIEAGAGQANFHYKVPISYSGTHARSQVPLLVDAVGKLQLISDEPDLRFEGAAIWSKRQRDEQFVWQLGVSGVSKFGINWEREVTHVNGAAGDADALDAVPESGEESYGFQVSVARHLTIIGPEGDMLHLARFELARGATDEELVLAVPNGLEYVSAQVDGQTVAVPPVVEGLCHLKLGAGPGVVQNDIEGSVSDEADGGGVLTSAGNVQTAKAGGARVVELMLRPSSVVLGFTGDINLSLPRSTGTEGRVLWSVAFPTEFAFQVRSGGLDQGAEKQSLSIFGEYGSALGGRDIVTLGKRLLRARPVTLRLSYVQHVPQLTNGLIKDYWFGDRTRR